MPPRSPITVRTVSDYAPVGTVATQEEGLDVAIRTILSQEKNRLVVVNGVIDPPTLKRFAVESGLAQKLLYPNTATIRSATLPSRPLDFLVVRFISIGCYVPGNDRSGSPDSDIRDQVMQNMAGREDQEERGGLNGYTRFRRLKIYGQGYFTVEQQAVFMEYATAASYTARGGRRGSGSGCSTWSGLLLNDTGGNKQENPPWETKDCRFRKVVFLPSETRDFSSVYRTVSAEDKMVAVSDPEVMDRDSPMHFAAALLTASALTYSQFVAFLREMLQHLPVDEGTASSRSARNNSSNNNSNKNNNSNSNITESIRLLHQARADLADAVDYFDEALQFCEAKGHDDLLSSVKIDLSTLRTKAISVSSLCKEKSDAINNEMTLQISNEALREGKRMRLVTYLGVVFAAVALSSSIFGMNVRGLGGPVPLYYFFVVSLFIGFLTTAFVLIFLRYGP